VDTQDRQDWQDEPIFERDNRNESPSFIRGYNEALIEFGALRVTRLGNQLTTMTAECKALRGQSEEGEPERDLREGRRARVHDLYYGKAYRNPQFNLEGEIQRVCNNGYIGVRGRIAYWAKGYRSTTGINKAPSGQQGNTSVSSTSARNGPDTQEGKKKPNKQSVRGSHSSRKTSRS